VCCERWCQGERHPISDPESKSQVVPLQTYLGHSLRELASWCSFSLASGGVHILNPNASILQNFHVPSVPLDPSAKPSINSE